jgi:hypothetical protein
MRRHVAILSAFVLLLAGCSSEDNGSEQKMANADDSEITYPHERPGAVLIWPDRNPDMVYDSETRRITDTKTGESFGVRQHMRSGGLHSAGIKDKNGEPVYGYSLKYGGKIVDGELVLVIWQVAWARRGDWLERFKGRGARENRAYDMASAEAQSDSLERLGQFLRAQRTGHMLEDRKRGMTVDEANDRVVIVDRRMDDTQAWEYY